MPRALRVARTSPSYTSSANRHSLPSRLSFTITPPGLRHTPSPDGLKPAVASSPSWSGMTSGGGAGAGHMTGFSPAGLTPGLPGTTVRAGLRPRACACSSDRRRSSEPSSCSKNAPEIRAWSLERRWQFAQSAGVSTATKVPSPRTWPHSVVTGPELGTRGVRWIRPPDFRRTDASAIRGMLTRYMMGARPRLCLLALLRLSVADPCRPRFAHALLLQGFVRLGLLDRGAMALSRHVLPPFQSGPLGPRTDENTAGARTTRRARRAKVERPWWALI